MLPRHRILFQIPSGGGGGIRTPVQNTFLFASFLADSTAIKYLFTTNVGFRCTFSHSFDRLGTRFRRGQFTHCHTFLQKVKLRSVNFSRRVGPSPSLIVFHYHNRLCLVCPCKSIASITSKIFIVNSVRRNNLLNQVCMQDFALDNM